MTATLDRHAVPVATITFPTGFPGLPGARTFELAPLTTEQPCPFGRLVTPDTVALDDGRAVQGLGLTVAAVRALWPAVEVNADDASLAAIGLDETADALWLAVVTVRDPVTESTANLFAPVLVNLAGGLAVQFVPKAPEATVGREMHTPLPLSSM